MDKIKLLILAFLILGAVWMAYYYITLPQKTELVLGNEVNLETFNSILGDAESVHIVMDVRDVEDQQIKTNILQCGVDFAGSFGLVGKNLSIYSFDNEQGCIGMGENYPLSYCIQKMEEQGVVLLIEGGNSTTFYSNAMKVGVGNNYTVGTCSVKIK
jgi:hypothetical protein